MQSATADRRRGHAPESAVDQLERLAALHAQGSLSDEEFAAAKRGLLPELP
jgi:hypothetical protein